MSNPEDQTFAPEDVRPATTADLGWILTQVHHAIDELDFYNDEFKAFEKARVNQRFIEALFDYDPRHLLVLRKDGERAGFMISGPDNGVVFLYWSYIIPQFRKSKLAVVGNAYFVKQFDNDQFHKLSTYTRSDNRTALIILKRFGWTEVAHLENQIFGQDYKIFEINLTKSIPGYRPFVIKGRLGQLKRKLKSLIGK